MNTLQNTFENVFRESFSPENFLSSIIRRKFKSKGIVLSDKQQKQLKAQIKEGIHSGTFDIRLDEKEFLKCPARLKKKPVQPISIEIDADKELASLEETISDITTKVLPKITADATDVIFKSLKKSYPQQKKYHNNQLKSFQKGIDKDWGKPIDLLEMLCFLSDEAGSKFNQEFRPLAASTGNFVFDVLSRLHARGCQITSEIVLLLRNGFADGAHARWRTLHEISVIGYFIAKHGNDTAERYLCHDAIESYKAAGSYQKHCESLGYKKMTDQEYGTIRSRYEFFVNKYGIRYKKEYGWASAAINNDNPKLSDIESDVGLSHMRPYYRMACHNVHANPKGIMFKLGLLPESGDILLSGPSNLGLTDPGHSTALSLLQITTKLLTSNEPNLDTVVVLTILTRIEREIGEAFLNADTKLKKRINKRYQQTRREGR